MELEARREPRSLTWLTLAFVVAVCALLVRIGADSRWLAALGEHIATAGSIPDGVPYAAAPSAGWDNTPVLGELVFYVLDAAFSDRGLVLAQILAVLAALRVVARDMRAAGATDVAGGFVLLATALAAAPALLVVRAQLFSLALFPLAVLLLRAEARAPSRRIWLVVPLVAVWSNLHGAVLVGVAAICAYLLFHRLRQQPAVAAGVLAASLAALLATPALLGTAAYYHDVLTSEAATRGSGMWAPLSLHAPFDILFLAFGIPLCAAAVLARPAAWELAVLAGLGAMSIDASRNAVWLVLFAAVPAARALRLRPSGGAALRRATVLCTCVLGFSCIVAVAQTPAQTAAGATLVRRAAAAARGTPVLADALNAEQLALAGQTIWIGNPLDAFRRRDQRLYLDWLEGRPQGDRVLELAPCAVLVSAGGVPQKGLSRNPGYREIDRDSSAVLYVRRECG